MLDFWCGFCAGVAFVAFFLVLYAIATVAL